MNESIRYYYIASLLCSSFFAFLTVQYEVEKVEIGVIIHHLFAFRSNKEVFHSWIETERETCHVLFIKIPFHDSFCSHNETNVLSFEASHSFFSTTLINLTSTLIIKYLHISIN